MSCLTALEWGNNLCSNAAQVSAAAPQSVIQTFSSVLYLTADETDGKRVAYI